MSELDNLKPIYFPTECNLDTDLFFPIAKNSTGLDCMMGYFTSGSLVELARSIVCFLTSSQSHKMRFIVSPNLAVEDLGAIKDAISYDKNLLPLLFPDFSITEETLRSNTIKALCFLVASGKLKLKVAIKTKGLFHSKCWMFRTDQGDLAVHGSGNATKAGLSVNFEQLVVSRSWLGVESAYICTDLVKRFSQIWGNDYKGILCVDLNGKTLEAINELKTQYCAEDNSVDAIIDKLISQLENENPPPANEIETQKLAVPDWLDYESGPFAHQGAAVDAWMKNNKMGILSIATGGGKTLTSLVAATLVNQTEKNLLVVIAVPTTALLNQWAEDVRGFSVEPVNTYKKNRRDIKKSLKTSSRKLRHGFSNTEVILITHDALRSELVESFFEIAKNIPIMLIGDEVHNLGSIGFEKAAPDCFKFRMGLSATYERQFDEHGTSFLLDYFGKVVFDYPLEEAIGMCLVPYDYFVHDVYLTAEEEEEFGEVSFKIKKLSYAANKPDGDPGKERWRLLCLERRRIIESAENKIGVFDKILPVNKGAINKTLVFCTDKYPEQLKEVNSILNDRSINFHQITHDETGQPKLLSRIVDSFNSGVLQVLTSKRVLDEGFNVPQTETAFLIASNTVRRQWIQRLGRVLRLSPKTKKSKAMIHDFMVLPAIKENSIDDDLVSLIRSEYTRLSYFSKLSSNGLEEGGSFFKIKKLLDLVRK
jgi:superfamily II DNA or RNA helicase